MESFITNGIITRDTYGDWCMPPEDPKLIHSKDPKRITAGTLMATPFFYNDLRLMQEYALELGQTNDADDYADVAEKMKGAFNEKYLNRGSGQYGNGTLTSSVLPLAFGMVPDSLRDKAFHYLVNKLDNDWQDHVGVGVIGAKYLLRVLSDNGRPDLAYSILTQTNYPGLGYMVQRDATTIWECWNGDTADPGMNSGNHVMQIGDTAIWLYEDLAGIKPDPAQPGFKHILMKPQPVGGLKFLTAAHCSPYGWIISQWKQVEKNFDWQIRIPANTTATVYIPARNLASVTESHQALSDALGVRLVGMKGDRAVVVVGSGDYHFQSIQP